MLTYGIRCDLLITAQDEKHLDEIMSNLEIRLTDNEGNHWDVEDVELLVAENGPEYILNEQGLEVEVIDYGSYKQVVLKK